jgi:tetratricopeptide (TPR) repeat protein
VADIADHEHTSALRCELEHLSSDAGAKLLRALGVTGHETELRSASDEFGGHCLALTLLGSYLTDAYDGDIRFRAEISERLADDVRQGAHTRKAMESYQAWFGEGPELSVLRMLGLFDRPVDESTLGVLLKPPAIRGLTESLTDRSPNQWRTILARLRRARLLTAADPHNPGSLDTHPLIREYFGEQLRSQQTEAWKECNRRLYNHYRTLAPQLPDNFRDMEPLFLAVICGCNAGLFRDALHEVYIPRIQRGVAYFAAKVLRATGPLLSALVHFFEHETWGLLTETNVGGQSLTAEDQLFILMQAAMHLTATRGMGSPEAKICFERAEPLCRSLNRPDLLHVALAGQCNYSLFHDKLTATLQIAKQIYSLAQEQDNPALRLGGCRALVPTLYFLGDFEAARQYAVAGLKIWRSGKMQPGLEVIHNPAAACLYFLAMCHWHFGEIASSQASITEAIALAKELNDLHGLPMALFFAGNLAQLKGDADQVERFASEVIELSTRQNFAMFVAAGIFLRGWAYILRGHVAEGISLVEDGERAYRACGSMLNMPYILALKAEALHLAHRTSEALEAISDAEALVERFEERVWSAELHRLRGVFLAAMGADETQIEASFCEAIRIAKQQKSSSLAARAEASYAEYRRHKLER